ncbi:Npr2, partial [Symbiodinium sp. KB8]
ASAPLARGGSGGDLLPPPASPSEGQGGGEQDALLSTGQVTAAGRHLRLMDTDILIPHPACTSLRLSCAHCCSRNCAALHRQALWLDSSLSARSLVLLFLACAVLLLADALAVRVHYPTASPDALLFHAGLLPCMLMVLSHIFRLRTGVQVTAAAGVLLEFLIITAATGVLGAAAPASILLVLLQLLGLAALALYNTFYTELNARRAMLLVMASHRAKRQADSVMGQLLPASVNDALNRNESIPFRMLPFDAVILWADLVGFTALSASMDSMAVLRLLHTIFAQCDALVEASGLWKLDTIGDAYVCVGFGEAAGQGPALVEKQFALALAMQDIVEKAGGGCGLGVRVGIHAGPVATGIIGTLRPRFYVFGRTVLEAEHMEASGATGRVQVSPAAASLYFQRTYGLQQREGAPAALFGEGPSPATFWLSPQGVLEPGDARQPRVEQE